MGDRYCGVPKSAAEGASAGLHGELCRRKTESPFRLRDYRRPECLQAKMGPLGHFMGEARLCRRRWIDPLPLSQFTAN